MCNMNGLIYQKAFDQSSLKMICTKFGEYLMKDVVLKIQNGGKFSWLKVEITLKVQETCKLPSGISRQSVR